jgi:hypothetical protein
MASKMRIPDKWVQYRPEFKKGQYLYNIDQAVGLDCPNKSEDVALVQFMLSIWEYHLPRAVLSRDLDPKYIYGTVPVTGKWGVPTLGFILLYQMINSLGGAGAQVDGRFEPLNSNIVPNWGANCMYLLNSDLRDEVPQNFQDLTKVPGIPGILVNALK